MPPISGHGARAVMKGTSSEGWRVLAGAPEGPGVGAPGPSLILAGALSTPLRPRRPRSLLVSGERRPAPARGFHRPDADRGARSQGRPVLRVARDELYLSGVASAADPVPVELFFVQPPVSLGSSVDEHGQVRLVGRRGGVGRPARGHALNSGTPGDRDPRRGKWIDRLLVVQHRFVC
jgi:hypothetical protein